MSATQRKLEFSVVVEDYERQPEWLTTLCELSNQSCDDLIMAMLDAEMRKSGEKFMAKFPELFRTTDLI